MVQYSRIHCVISALAASLALPATIQAADEPATTRGLEEIVVTAQKQAENLQDVPISILAIGPEELEKRHVVSLSDINNGSVPGLNLAPYPGSADFFFPTFRGITTNTAFISGPSPIAVHVDGVYYSQLVGLNLPAADLERIEVLKGPQGVLSGRNATGGALNLYTARPRIGEFGFKQELSYAERDQWLSKTVVNVPVGATFAAKFSYLLASRADEGIRNTAPGGPDFGKRDVDAWRFDARWQPEGADVTVDYGYDGSSGRGYDTPAQCRYPAPAVTAALPTGDPRITTFIEGCSAKKKLDGLYYPFDIPKNRNDVEGHTLNVEWRYSDALTLRSITGYREVDTKNGYNYGAYAGGADVRSDSGPLLVPDTPFNGESHPVKLYNEAWSEELQLLGDLSESLSYTAGVYYYEEEGHQYSGPNVGIYLPSGGGAPGLDFVMVDEKGLRSSKSDSWAVFGQLVWRPEFLDRKLEVVPGLRYTEDNRTAVGYNTGWTVGYGVIPTGPGTGILAYAAPMPGGAGFASAKGDLSFSETTPALSLNYHWTDAVMVYAKYAEAYTSGGFDPVSGPATADVFVKGYKPEYIDSIELGLKGEFLEQRLRVNLALFQSKFTDEQKSVALPSGGWKVENVGKSTYEGLELDVTAAITPSLIVTASFAALDHDYDEWIDPATGADVTKQRKLIVSDEDYSISVDYEFPDFGLPGTLSANLNFSHRGDTSTPLNLDIEDVELYSVTPAFSVWNARIALSDLTFGPGERHGLTIALWGKNLADEEYMTLAYQGWVTAGSASWGDPRTFGVDMTYKF